MYEYSGLDPIFLSLFFFFPPDVPKFLLVSFSSFFQKLLLENTMVQNLWDAAKEVLRWKFIQAYLKKQEKISNNLTLHLKELEKEQTKSKPSKGRK